jgi:pimeloyl-ACP methyl ester carboxylesterase
MPEARQPGNRASAEGGGELRVSTDDGVVLAGSQEGEGQPVVLLHGLTGTRRYVVMGSRVLERSGHRVIAYDARGHGRSTPAPSGSGACGRAGYGYGRLAADLGAVLDACALERAVLAGSSMGAHTIVRFALEHPERVDALAIVTPAFDPGLSGGERELAEWDALACGLREDGVEGFVRAYDFSELPAGLRETVATVVRQRLSQQQHPAAVADALEAVPRSRPFEDFAQLAALDMPTLVVASRDQADPGHPLAVGERYARAIPGAELLVEERAPAGEAVRSPIAWQGGRLSRAIAALAARVRA